MSNEAQSVVPFSAGRVAAKRCLPYLDKARVSFLEMCKKIGAEYGALEDQDKADFRKSLGLNKTTLKQYAAIASLSADKLRVIQEGGHHGATLIPPSKNTWAEIVYTKDAVLKQAAKKGLFTDFPVTRENIVRFKKTGQLPVIRREKTVVPSVLELIRAEIQKADASINRAVGHVSKARGLIDENEITRISGPELTSFRRQLELLYAEVAAIKPDLLNAATKILRGEV